jgi:hypothetical protein
MEETGKKKKLSEMNLDDIKRQVFGGCLEDDGQSISEQEATRRIVMLGNYLMDNIGDDDDHFSYEQSSSIYKDYEKELNSYQVPFL